MISQELAIYVGLFGARMHAHPTLKIQMFSKSLSSTEISSAFLP